MQRLLAKHASGRLSAAKIRSPCLRRDFSFITAEEVHAARVRKLGHRKDFKDHLDIFGWPRKLNELVS